MSEPALAWQGACFAVRQGFWMRRRRILHDIDLCVAPGTVLGLVGPNGAGKTTTIKLGAGLVPPEKGRVRINGRAATDVRARLELGLLTEAQYIYPHLKLREWLDMLGRFSGLTAARRRRRVGTMLERVELADRAEQLMHTLSKGQLQRAGIAQAFLHEPPILLLDEPMSGLDPLWRYRVQQMLLAHKAAGGTILFSSHILADVEKISDRVALVRAGRLHWSGRLSDMPRRIKGFEAVCRTSNPGALAALAGADPPKARPDGAWTVQFGVAAKADLLELVARNEVELEQLRPFQEEIEEVLFGVGSSALQDGADE